jgi:hypothetical protein
MTRLIEAYQTSDGTIHLTRSAADKHQKVVLTNAFGALIDSMSLTGQSIGVKIKMCERLEVFAATDPAGLVNTLQDIINIINHDDASDE